MISTSKETKTHLFSVFKHVPYNVFDDVITEIENEGWFKPLIPDDISSRRIIYYILKRALTKDTSPDNVERHEEVNQILKDFFK